MSTHDTAARSAPGARRCVGYRQLKHRLVATALVALFGGGPVAAQTLVVAATKTPGGFDGDALKPNTQNVVTQVYEGLVAYAIRTQPDGSTVADFSDIRGHLAESWQVSDGGKTYVFKLRRGVKSPFGNEFRADDVVWGWQKSIAQKRTGNFMADVSGVTAVDKVSDHEVRFTLKAPSGIFLHALTDYVPGIYDDRGQEARTPDDPWALKWIDANTAGFGAYHLESVKQGEQAVFVANPNYFGSQPHYNASSIARSPRQRHVISCSRQGRHNGSKTSRTARSRS